jgi:hypothetical protein
MRVRSICAVVLVAEFLACPSAAPARLVERWDYDRLFKEADLVVLAVAVQTDRADDKPPDHSWPHEFVGQNTTLKVRYALKGKADAEQIKVLHFKFGELKKGVDPNSLEAAIILDGPNLVGFRTGPVTVRAGKDTQVLPPPEYLLFLKRMKDGRYEPVAGQIDPAFSVREVSAPLDRVLGVGK